MRKILSGILLAILLFLGVLIKTNIHNIVNAQEDAANDQQQSVQKDSAKKEASEEAAFKPVPYNLAYPGILPDHPLYKLKILKDKIAIFLISNPEKKAKFYLLQADKGILATAILVDKKKFDLAEKTAYKAEHNYTLLTFEIKKMPEKPSEDFFEKLKIAALKHQEVLGSLIKRVPENKKKSFEQVLQFSKTNLKTVEDYQKEEINY